MTSWRQLVSRFDAILPFSPWWLFPLDYRVRRGTERYGSLSFSATRVSRNRIVKVCYQSELDAMRYVAKHTTIRVPKVYRVYPAEDDQISIEMERIEGEELGYAWKEGHLSEDNIRDIMSDLESMIGQLRKLTPPKEFVASASGGAFSDIRIGQLLVGPYESHLAFHKLLCGGAVEGTFGPDVDKVHKTQYRTCFTHADLAPRNIIVRNGRIAAIIDWGFSGWYPEYWEYTKARYGIFRREEWLGMLERAMPGYETELAAERFLWDRYDDPGLPRYVDDDTHHEGPGMYIRTKSRPLV